MPKPCEANVMKGYRQFPCKRNATTQREGHHFCTQHAKIVDRWKRMEKDIEDMMHFWWSIPRG